MSKRTIQLKLDEASYERAQSLNKPWIDIFEAGVVKLAEEALKEAEERITNLRRVLDVQETR